jgi:predicted alpha-1,2-mannosidase
MSKSIRFVLFIVLIFQFSSCNKPAKNLTDFVNPFIGTGGHGHTFPGATLPFGMVQLSPDTRTNNWDACSGYHYSDSIILGFSHTHLSGTGVGDYGDIRFMPTTGKLFSNPGKANNTHAGYCSSFSHQNEKATPGYYQVFLDDYGISVELSATNHVGFHRYTFPKSDSSHILIDLSESIVSEKIRDLEIHFENDSTLSGKRQSQGWASDQHIYFVAQFSRAFQHFGIIKNGQKFPGLKDAKALDLKAWVDYSTREKEKIIVKVGISAVSIEGARKNLEFEASTWNFDKIINQAKLRWEKSLDKIQVESPNKKNLEIFYTALYHSMLAPNLFSDADGKYRGHDQKIHQASHPVYTVFSLWDTFRAEHPLLTIIDQKRSNDMIKSMLLIYQQSGLLPVWELAGNETNCMIGYHAVPVIADAMRKHIGDFDKNLALEAMKKSANLDQFGLRNYKSLGYVKADEESESVSRTLEYAYDDWCIAQTCDLLHDSSNGDYFRQRAQNYQNVLDPSTGFMRARINGGWQKPFSPSEVNFHFTEANSWQYSFFVPQDINRLIEFLGGDKPFENRLDELFTTQENLSGRQQSDISGLIGQYAHGNEPSHHMAYLYNYIGKAFKTQKIVHQIKTELYTNQPDGLSGNEDCGQMSAWYVMSALGFYEVCPASNTYVIGTPSFKNANIQLENGKHFIIRAHQLSDKHYFIQDAKWNGKNYAKSFFTHSEMMQGGELSLKMQSKPNRNWAEKENARPKSLITKNRICPDPYIDASALTFRDSLKIEMGDILKEAKIYYSVDGSTPDSESKLYSKPFYIHRSNQFKAIAIHPKFGKSKIVKANYHHISSKTKLKLKYPYSKQYPAAGELALIDQIRGNNNFKTGTWQGFYGVDVEAQLDLGGVKSISKMTLGCIQDIYSWIFMPAKVSFYSSLNGKEWTLAGVVPNRIDEHREGGVIENFSLKIIPYLQARYIKVIAKNRGNCPDWHVGAGNKSWIFADEIIIE